MKTISDIADLRAARRALTGTVGFVPTMGALHTGHLSLMEHALERCDHLIVSIFVNPTQFAPGEDLETYPRDPEGDLEKCRAVGADFVFMPTPELMYENGRDQPTVVSVEGLTSTLCGRSRPTHFDGVTTVVSKLFNLVQPDLAIFGEKDYQQLAVIRQMTRDLNFPIEIYGAPIAREADGLAMSSRNRRLRPEHREHALALSRGLLLARQAFQAGERDPAALEAVARERMEAEDDLRVDYCELVHPDTLQPLREAGEAGETAADGAVLAVAAFLGDVRLIDNLRLDLPLPAALADLAP